MSLNPGSRIGPYEVNAQIGLGGMGEVYQATDTNLARQVAIKVLPDALAADGDRLARFDREARTLAALNHPNIATIYGLERSNGRAALVMELVEGLTLADRIAASRIPLDEALAIAKQIAEALEAAHEQGIIHRDLKPANIKLRPDGAVKILDFGLAKALEPVAARGIDASESPTITSPAMLTAAGVILGTAAYVSPEQARGMPADRRSDIWAFGVVLFEMLAGRRVFAGDDVSSTIASVLRDEPPWNQLPAETPRYVHALLRKCLQKDPRKRLPHIGILRLELDEGPSDETGATVTSAPAVSKWRWVVPSVAAAALLSTVTGLVVWQAKPAPPRAVTRLSFVHSGGFGNSNFRIVDISPDGSRIVYSTGNELYLRSLADFDVAPIPGTQGQKGISGPVFSPDGQQVLYASAADRGLKKIAVDGGAPVTLCTLDTVPMGVSWQRDDTILFAQPKGIMRVSAKGGKPELVAAIKEGEIAYGPQMLPGDRVVLFTLAPEGEGVQATWNEARIVVQPLLGGDRKIVVEGSDARYVPTGHLVFARGGALFAAPFDAEALAVTGDVVPVQEGVLRWSVAGTTRSGVAHFAISSAGSLVYLPGRADPLASERDLVVVDRSGAVQKMGLPQRIYDTPRVSPDERQIAFSVDDGRQVNVYLHDVGSTSIRRLTFGGRNRFPIWSADGTRIAFQSDREGDKGIFWQKADGSDAAGRLTRAEAGTSHVPESWARAESLFSYSVVSDADSSASLWILSVKDRKSTPFGQLHAARSLNSAFSPDGRFIAYTLRQRNVGTSLVVEPFPPTGAQYEVAGADQEPHHPVWSRDGKRIFYFPAARPLVAVDVGISPAFEVLRPPVDVPGAWSPGVSGMTPESQANHDVFGDGRFITARTVAAESEASNDREFRVILNWLEELTRLAPKRGRGW